MQSPYQYYGTRQRLFDVLQRLFTGIPENILLGQWIGFDDQFHYYLQYVGHDHLKHCQFFVTYLLSPKSTLSPKKVLLIFYLYSHLAQRNLSKKTLLDEKFLIWNIII